MLELNLPHNLDAEYILNSVYIFNYGKVEILATFLRFEKGYNVFETSQSSYKHVLDTKIVASKHKVHIIKQDFNGAIIKEEVAFKDIIVTYLDD